MQNSDETAPLNRVMHRSTASRGPLVFLGVTAVLCSAWSIAGTTQLDVWAFELLPGLIGVCGLIFLARWFSFSTLVYCVITIAFIFIATGARYTYAEVPLADWVGDSFGWKRNSFDRLGHLVQGLTVGLMTREVLLRRTTLSPWCGVPILTIAFALSFSALYELVEWWTVLAFYADHGPEWLGTQGDPWDAQQDMAMGLSGAILATTFFAPFQDWSIRRLRNVEKRSLKC
mgnify:CR=1 FL=1